MRGRDSRAEERERFIKMERSLGLLTDDQAQDRVREVREREQMSFLDRLERATEKCANPPHDSRDDVGFGALFNSGEL